MFSRNELQPGTQAYEEYYRIHPEKKPLDDKFRELPGILSPLSREADPVIYASANSNFSFIDNMQRLVDGPVAVDRVPLSTEDITRYLKTWILKLGAHSVGITELKEYHIYTVGGRNKRYGIPIKLRHKYALVYTVEMDAEMIASAPAAPTIMESAQQYLRAGTIAIQVAMFLRSLGYSARAHIDANYQVVAPSLASDAGLGEVGRMSILMTPKLGPRCRLGVITTELPLICDTKKTYNSIIDFCNRCKKCAVVCPSQAISYTDRTEEHGILRWKINHEKCFTYWCKAGTDCARCMAVCPYSYPDSAPHNLVRWAARRSGFTRRAVITLDRVFYGAAPEPKPAPDWVPPRPERIHTGYS